MNIMKPALRLAVVLIGSALAMDNQQRINLSPQDQLKNLIGDYNFYSTDHIQIVEQGSKIQLPSGKCVSSNASLTTIITTIKKSE